MIKIYGIKTCGSVRKALKFFKDNNIEIQYIDLRTEAPNKEKINHWATQIDIDILMNKKGTTYKKLGIKDLNPTKEEKLIWLEKEPMLFKRPIIENKDKVYIAFNEEEYKENFL